MAGQSSSTPIWKCEAVLCITKHSYSNILKMSPPKNCKFSDKNSDIFSYFCSKHRLYLVEAVLTSTPIYVFEQN